MFGGKLVDRNLLAFATESMADDTYGAVCIVHFVRFSSFWDTIGAVLLADMGRSCRDDIDQALDNFLKDRKVN